MNLKHLKTYNLVLLLLSAMHPFSALAQQEINLIGFFHALAGSHALPPPKADKTDNEWFQVTPIKHGEEYEFIALNRDDAFLLTPTTFTKEGSVRTYYLRFPVDANRSVSLEYKLGEGDNKRSGMFTYSVGETAENAAGLFKANAPEPRLLELEEATKLVALALEQILQQDETDLLSGKTFKTITDRITSNLDPTKTDSADGVQDPVSKIIDAAYEFGKESSSLDAKWDDIEKALVGIEEPQLRALAMKRLKHLVTLETLLNQRYENFKKATAAKLKVK